MKKLIPFLFLLASCSLFDTEIARVTNRENPDEYVALYSHQGHCPSGKQAKIHQAGKDILGCYLQVAGTILILWDDGDKDMIPVSVFTFK